ncbi:MAG: hypothetical protein WAN30_02730 [Acidimicrobiales bacterium]
MASSQPHHFRVLWGDFSKGLEQEIVVAHDVDEALTIAHERRPELPRPRTALLVTREG